MKILRAEAFVPIMMILVPAKVDAFAVHGQTQGVPYPPKHVPAPDAGQAMKKGASLSGAFNGRKHVSGTALSAAALPAIGQFAAASFLPTCLGLWRTGYAVSYGYGASMLLSGLLQLLAFRGTIQASLSLQLHSALYIFYGVRLCLFLLHREIRFPVEIHQMTRRDASLSERLKRLPVIIGCSVLYFCMAAGPMRSLALADPKSNILTLGTLSVGFAGFLLAAVGDWYKAKTKARDGPQKLVTTGPFRYFRHPNYTGEMIGWTCLCVLLPMMSIGGNIRRVIPWLAASVVGWAGMVFAVLIGEATVGLEKKQKEKYGGTPEYEEWIKSSWSGPMFSGSNK